jgi:hypothetical protein
MVLNKLIKKFDYIRIHLLHKMFVQNDEFFLIYLNNIRFLFKETHK